MLGDEHRMTAKWRLLSIILRLGGRETLRDEVGGVLENRGQSPFREIRPFPRTQAKALAERGAFQRQGEFI
jgi:hypothetical protein